MTLESDWDAGGKIKYLFVQLDLASENVAVTWYSSTLLLLGSVMALFCFVVDRKNESTRTVISWGWLMLSAMLLVLSADEVGSIHERLGMLPALNFSGTEAPGWIKVLSIPIAGVALCLITFGVVRVRRSPGALGFMLLGTALFGSIPLLDRMEMNLVATTYSPEVWFEHDLGVHIEEGSELYGALCFLAAASLYLLRGLAALKRSGPEQNVETLQVPAAWAFRAVTLLLAAMASSWFLIKSTGFSSIHHEGGGFLENWYPDALAMLLAIVTLGTRQSIAPERRSEHRHLTFLPIFFVGLAVYYGAYGKGWLGMTVFQPLHLQAIASIGIFAASNAVAAYLWPRLDTWLERAGLVAWVVLLGVGLLTGSSDTVDAIETTAYAVLLLVFVRRLQLHQANPAQPLTPLPRE